MAKFNVVDMNGQHVSEIELSDAVFGITPNEKAVHIAVVNFLANQRQGTQTADLALEVLQTGEFPEYVTVSGDIITVNTDTAATLGLDYSLFQDMGSQVVEVQTTQD